MQNEKKTFYVYRHTSPNGMIYIGITKQDPQKRWANGKGYSYNTHFNNAILKYGWENFTHEILYCGLTREEACQKEKELISYYKSNNRKFGYNITEGGTVGAISVALQEDGETLQNAVATVTPTVAEAIQEMKQPITLCANSAI